MFVLSGVSCKAARETQQSSLDRITHWPPAFPTFSQGYQEHKHLLHLTALGLIKLRASPVIWFSFDSSIPPANPWSTWGLSQERNNLLHPGNCSGHTHRQKDSLCFPSCQKPWAEGGLDWIFRRNSSPWGWWGVPGSLEVSKNHFIVPILWFSGSCTLYFRSSSPWHGAFISRGVFHRLLTIWLMKFQFRHCSAWSYMISVLSCRCWYFSPCFSLKSLMNSFKKYKLWPLG